jgi:hypothetical protein
MASYTFTNPNNGQRLSIRGPATLTRDQAQLIFDQQLKTGALVGLKAGDVINPVTQVAGGLTSAQAQLAQQIVDTKQTYNDIALRVLGVALTSTPVTNGITLADYAGQSEAPLSIAGMSTAVVTGVMAQVQKLANQAAAFVTANGVGKYALSAFQIETAGYIKPGTTARYSSGSTLADILKSPNVWTSKNNIQSIDEFLANESAQEKVQQENMIAGINQLQEVGIDVSALPVKMQAGVAMCAAKDPVTTEQWLKGKTIPSATQILFSQYVRDGAYAVDFTENKVGATLQRQVPANGTEATIDRSTVNAATSRIVGNDKVPALNYGGQVVDLALVTQYDDLYAQYSSSKTLLASVQSQISTATQNTAEIQQAQLQSLLPRLQQLLTLFTALRQLAVNSTPLPTDFIAKIDQTIADIQTTIAAVNSGIQILQQIKTQGQYVGSTV